MTSEILAVPEENLEEVIKVIRAGIQMLESSKYITTETINQLTKWCNEEEEYLKRMKDE